MVFRRKTMRKPYRRPMRKLRRYRKKRSYAIARPFGRSQYFRRTMQATTIVFPTAVSTFGSFSFTLDSLPNYTEFTNLYDEYMIRKVKIMFLPIGATQQITDIITASIPHIAYVIDQDDASAPATMNDLMQYPTVKYVKANRRFAITVSPRFSQNVYISGISTGYGSRRGFLDCGNPNIPHFGVKYGLYNSNTANLCGYQVHVTYFLAFRGVR